jgi:hypothetical protein
MFLTSKDLIIFLFYVLNIYIPVLVSFFLLLGFFIFKFPYEKFFVGSLFLFFLLLELLYNNLVSGLYVGDGFPFLFFSDFFGWDLSGSINKIIILFFSAVICLLVEDSIKLDMVGFMIKIRKGNFFFFFIKNDLILLLAWYSEV